MRSSIADCWSRTCRAWIVEDDEQRPAAAVVAVRPTFDRWYAMVLLLDEARRSRCRRDRRSQPGVECERCRARHRAADPVAPAAALRRRATLGRHGVPDRRHRRAGRRHPPGERGRPRRARRAVLDVRVRRRTDGLAVADDAAPRARPALRHRRRLAGRRGRARRRAGDHDSDASTTACSTCSRSCRTTVVRAGRGHSSPTRSRSATRSASPAWRRSPDRTRWTSTPTCDDDTYVAVELVPPRRFRGQGRLRALYGRWQPLQPRAPIWFREPGDNRRTSDRRRS